MRKAWSILLKTFKTTIFCLGVLALLMIIVSFTSLPYWARYSLGTHNSHYKFQPAFIVMMGGCGMPSEDNLMRLYFTAALANKYQSSEIIIALPYDSLVYDKMKQELLSKGIDTNRVKFERKGVNTRSQALFISEMIPKKDSGLVIVSSPEHIYRSVLAFRKVGFSNVGGEPTFENNLKDVFDYDSDALGGRKYVPNVGEGSKLRYNLWSYLKLEIICLREYTAISYYYLKDWI